MSESTSPQPQPFQRILVMRYRFIGDTVLTVPLLRNLRRTYPNATIDLLAGPNSGELLEHCPYINNLLLYDTTRKHAYENPTDGAPAQSFWSYGKQLRHKRYDLALVLKRSLSSAMLAWMSWIPTRVGFDTEGRRYLLTEAFPYNRDKPEWDCFLDGLRALNVPITDTHLEAWWTPAEEANASQRLAQAAIDAGLETPLHLALHATTSNETKALPLSFFMAYTQAVLDAYPNAVLHALGAPQDSDFYQRLRQTLPTHQQARLAIHCGQTTLRESQALLAQCILIAGVDSGTLHMAAAAGTPVVGYYLPELAHKWTPGQTKAQLEGHIAPHSVITTPDVDAFLTTTRTIISMAGRGE